MDVQVETDIGEVAKAADDLELLIAQINKENEPMHYERMILRMCKKLTHFCKVRKLSPDAVVKAACADLTAEEQADILSVVKAMLSIQSP